MRDIVILVALGLAAAAACIFVFYSSGVQPSTSAASAQSGSAAAVIPFTPLASGSHAAITQRVNYIVTSQSQLDTLWKLTGASSTPPAIDFSKDVVMGVFAGQQPAAGYSIAVSKIEDTGSKRTVVVTITKPGAGCANAAVTTTPYELIESSATTLQVTHTDVDTSRNCAQ